MNTVPLILVGTGEYYSKILKPALYLLETRGHAQLVCTVDLQSRKGDSATDFSDMDHRIRNGGEKLSTLLKDFSHLDPVVILGHANDMHVADAEDLVRAGFRVLVEKPFALSEEELERMKKVVEEYPQRICLVEYYLTMKSAPLFALTGQLHTDSFFFREGLLKENGSARKELASLLGEQTIFHFLGQPRSVFVEILEGEGSVGRLDHRGKHLTDRALGGGMIHDLGIHALAPLFPLEGWIGKLEASSVNVKTAHCREYLNMARELFSLEPEQVAESYALISLTTSRNVPVAVRVGKYTPQNRNQRGLSIVTERGTVFLDLSSPHISVRIGELSFQEIFTLPKTEEKYYSVLRSCILELEGKSPYSFSINNSSIDAQELVLKSVAISQGGPIREYQSGIDPEKIFQ